MRYLVVGGAGYIGSHFVRQACDADHSVCVMDNLSTGYKSSVDKRAIFWYGDINSEEDSIRCITNFRPDVVFGFAGLKAAGDSMRIPHEYSHTNIGGMHNLLFAMQANNVRRFVFSSSAAVYGTPEYLPIDERHPTNPSNYYGFTKLHIEEVLKWYSKLHKITFASLRYFNAAGYDVSPCETFTPHIENKPTNLLPVVMETVKGQRDCVYVYGDDYDTADGTGVRDYIHVNDLASAHLMAAEHIIESGVDLIVNLGTEIGHSVLEVIDHAQKITDITFDYKIIGRRDGDPAEVIASNKLAKAVLGWSPYYSDIDTILKSMWRTYSD